MPENIIELAKIIMKEYERDIKKNKNAYMKFFLKGSNSSQYKSGDIGIFTEREILKDNRITSIKMIFHNRDEEKMILVNLIHLLLVEITIHGKDEIWVNGVSKTIEDRLSNCKESRIWTYPYEWPLIIFFDFAIGLPVIKLLEIFSLKRIIDLSLLFPKLPEFLFDLYLAFALGFIPSLIVVDRISKLCPHVKLITDPEHALMEERKKAKLYLLISLVIPFLISIIIDIIKIIFLNH